VTSTCPAGHTSESDDYCDVCGAPIGAPAPTATGSGMPSIPSIPGGAPAGPGAGGAVPASSGAAPGSGSMLDLGPSGAAAAGPACPNCGAVSVPGALFCEDCGYDFTTGQLPRTDPAPLPPPTGMASGMASGTAAPGLGEAAGAPSDLTPPPLAPPAGMTPSPLPTTGDVPPPQPSDAGGTVPPGQLGPVEWVAEVWIDPDWHAAQEVSEPCPSPGMPEVIPLRGVSQLIGRRSVSRNIHPQIDCGADTGVSRRHAQLTTDGQRWWVEDLQSSNGTYVGTAGGPLPDVPVQPGQRTELPDDARVYVGAWTRIVVRPATAEERTAAG
jgi:hypothetical protein